MIKIKKVAIKLGLIVTAIVLSSTSAFADSDHHYKHSHHDKHVIHRGHDSRANPKHAHVYKNVRVDRYYGHHYGGYGYYKNNNDAYKWLAFTAITLKVLDNLNEHQQREHEAAQVAATKAKVGETIVWNEGAASGAVTVVRDGTTTSGRYCREYQHEVTIGGRTERAYGTACQQPDGSWEIISTDT